MNVYLSTLYIVAGVASWNKHTVLRTTIHVQHLIMFKKETSVEPELRSIFQV